ncbi:MAG: hypothetical protein GEV00_20560 [Actinophytocola sp.]|nr:hypothetical protein [Actinophytocola sp.]
MTTQSGLPAGVSAFVGRERERATVADLVAAARVVTLTGSGGCGKTRLAAEVARDVAARFADGACWVDLQAVNEPGLVAPAIGGAVGIHERPGQALTDTLAEQLHPRHLLVVLDNCEHLVEVCAELVGEFSAACPRLHVLATSRVPLVVEGEATFEVAGLPVPEANAESGGTVAAADAARLFEVGPGRSPGTSGSGTTTRRPWPRSADTWTESRWRSNWRRRGCGCWRRARSRPGSRTGSRC